MSLCADPPAAAAAVETFLASLDRSQLDEVYVSVLHEPSDDYLRALRNGAASLIRNLQLLRALVISDDSEEPLLLGLDSLAAEHGVSLTDSG